MGKTVRTHDDEEDFGEDFHMVDYNPKAKRHRLAERAEAKAKAKRADKFENLSIKKGDD